MNIGMLALRPRSNALINRDGLPPMFWFQYFTVFCYRNTFPDVSNQALFFSTDVYFSFVGARSNFMDVFVQR